MKLRTRQLITTGLITSVLSIFIGGFAVWSSYQGEIGLIDSELSQLESDVRINPMDAVSVAMMSIEQNNFDFTLAYSPPSGELTILRQSENTPIEGSNLIVRYISISEGAELIVAASIVDINKTLKS
ncbi:MAG: hypothetical protein F2524_01305, partial [Actinobacteria bacterium]|nr:hypothetical protein [Actinomycetota bacterium]